MKLPSRSVKTPADKDRYICDDCRRFNVTNIGPCGHGRSEP